MSRKPNERFSLYYRNGYAVLRVFPPSSPGDQVYAEEIANRMKLLQIPMVRMKILEEIIERADGTRETLVEWPAGASLSPQLNLRISEDKMQAEILIDPPRVGGGTVTREQFEHLLEDHGITSGIDWEAVSCCVEKETYNKWLIIASGVPAVHGKGGRIRYHFNIDRGRPFKELPGGRIDLKELNFIQYKKKGDLLTEKVDPVFPKEGFNIFGETVEALPMDEGETIQAGAGTLLRDDCIYADEDGNVRIEKGAVIIEPVVTVNNVDYETGNLEFDGSVIVKGTIADGFSVKVSGDLQIAKSVGRIHAEAGRNVILQSGINGDKEGRIRAGGDIYARFVESSLLISSGSLIVTGSILHSTLNVSGHLLLEGGRSEIIGGLGVVRGWVKCRKIGSLYETRTNLIVGVEPEELDAFLDHLKQLDQKRDKLDNLDRQIQFYAKKNTHPGTDPSIMRQIEILEKEAGKITKEIKAFQETIKNMRKNLQPDPDSFVLAEDMIYPGAKISFGLNDFLPDNRGTRKTILQFKEGRFRETGYNPAQIPRDIARHLPKDTEPPV